MFPVFRVCSHFFTKKKKKRQGRDFYAQVDMTQGTEGPHNHKTAQEKPKGYVGAPPQYKMLS